jgi:hypothetical protein
MAGRVRTVRSRACRRLTTGGGGGAPPAGGAKDDEAGPPYAGAGTNWWSWVDSFVLALLLACARFVP